MVKTLAVDAFIPWRMAQNQESLRSTEEFGSLDRYPEVLNGVHSLADFVFDSEREMLVNEGVLLR